jgi:hypothetical protein
MRMGENSDGLVGLEEGAGRGSDDGGSGGGEW